MKNETILSIDHFEDTDNDGIKITTTQQEIVLGISNHQQCCENPGYFLTEDDVSEFIGAGVLDVSITDGDLKHHTLMANRDFGHDGYYDGDEEFAGSVMFVNIETTSGTLQFVAYNSHNGYYGHDAIVSSKQLNHKVEL